MEIKLKWLNEGNAVKIIVLIVSERAHDTGVSQEIDISGLALVKFCYTQMQNGNMQSKVMVRKKPIDSAVKLKVHSQEFMYSFECVISENESWNEMGHTERYLKTKTMSVYLFNVYVTASKMKCVVHDKLYNDTDFTDFHLSTAEGFVAVHKACLATHSEVFKRMLSQEWKETTDAKLQIEGVTLQTLHHLKKYIYLGILPDEGLEPLLSIASCYLLEDLKAECITKLSQNVRPENFYKMLEYSLENKFPELTFALVKVTPKYVVESAEILRITEKDVPKRKRSRKD